MPHPPNTNVLIAEDNPFDRTILKRAFAAAGSHATLRFFDNGEDLLVYLRSSVDEPAQERGLALVLLDMHMPRMNGKETLQHSYLTALSWADLTFVLPSTAFGYVVVALLAKFWQHETIALTRWLGILLIVCGVGFVANGPSLTEHPAKPSEQELEKA